LQVISGQFRTADQSSQTHDVEDTLDDSLDHVDDIYHTGTEVAHDYTHDQLDDARPEVGSQELNDEIQQKHQEFPQWLIGRE
jgi:hypothetical protein